jgi:TonB-linked SusC/RagA family outer membrane protein
MKGNNRLFEVFLLFLLFEIPCFFKPLNGFAQQNKGFLLKGTVKTIKGELIPGANILESGTYNGAVTDINGNFSLNLKTGDAIIRVSVIGFRTREINVENRQQIDIVIEEDITKLDEVVVVGYGTQKKSDLTGSVTSVGTKDIQSMSVLNAAESLKGRVAGLQVTQTDAAPGGNVAIRLRGFNSINSGNNPLIVIDGYTNAGNLNTLNPRDIKSIEVLKDASATAIYGSRGANGVILITTISGGSGDLKVSFNTSYSIKTLQNKIELLDSRQFMTLANEAVGSKLYSDDEIAKSSTTDWQDMVYQNGHMLNSQLTITGGGEKTGYNLSVNYLDDEGVVLNSYFKRFSIRSKTNTNFNKYINFSNTIYFARTNSNGTPRNTTGYVFDPGVSDGAITFWPHLPVYDQYGAYVNMPNKTNPYAIANERIDNLTRNYLYDYAELEIKPIKGMQLKSTFGATVDEAKQQEYWPSKVQPVAGGTTKGIAEQTSSSVFSWSNENIANYAKAFGKHNLFLTAAFTQENSKYSGFDGRSTGFISDLLTFNNMEGGQNIAERLISSGASEVSLMSFLGRVNYHFNQKYYLTASIRSDGSSKFAANNKWGHFPSVALGYRLIEEQFFRKMNNLSNLKLRASWGITGNSGGLGNYESLTIFSPTTFWNAVFNDKSQIGLILSNLPNENLKWEKTNQTNIGFDVGLFQDRVILVADVYYKKTTDLLLVVNLPSGYEVSTRRENVGAVENKGFEFSLSTINIKRRNFNWDSKFNFSLFRNKVLELAEQSQFTQGSYSGLIADDSPTNLVKVGEPLGNYYGYVSLGVFPDNSSVSTDRVKYSYLPNPNNREGYIKLKDINDDGKIDAADRTIIGCAQPDFDFGFSNQFFYNNFDLTIFIEGVVGSDIYNVSRYNLDATNGNTNASVRVLNRWTPENRITEIPKAGAFINKGVSTFVEDGSYVKFRDIQLGYNFNKLIPPSWNILAVRLYVSAQNLITITKYSGYDPEVNSRGSSSIQQNIDLGSYPSSMSLHFGINIDF